MQNLQTGFSDIPVDIICQIVSFVPVNDVLSVRILSKKYRNAINKFSSFWKTIVPPNSIGTELKRTGHFKPISLSNFTGKNGDKYYLIALYELGKNRVEMFRRENNEYKRIISSNKHKIKRRKYNIEVLKAEVIQLECNNRIWEQTINNKVGEHRHILEREIGKELVRLNKK